MFVSSIGTINNAAFGVQQNRNGIMDLSRLTGDGSFGDIGSIHQSEKRLQANNLQDQLTYKASSLMEESHKKLEKENIKRTFSTFA